ncbi:MAG: hypothetical protein BGO55_09195 [Sphingobacteriales bacterium 50-39]|nr:hypothetical protein [Sphingobacteriales bacterium]OJW57721.1 MAG: hypothetical protein BGO55_09195 [Sphingobacteriales bacterium 50-39]
MNELFEQTNETRSMEGEILKALVGKVVDLGASVKENLDQTKRLVEHVEEIGEVKERMVSQEKRVEELVQKNAEVVEAIQQVAAKIDIPVEKIELLQGSLQQHSQLFEKPLDKTVYYHHFVGKAVWVLSGMVIITVCALTMMAWQWQRAGRYAQDEMKWRFVKLSTDSVVSIMVNRAESRGRSDPDGLARDVQYEEARRESLMRNLLREQEARRQIYELEKKKLMEE